MDGCRMRGEVGREGGRLVLLHLVVFTVWNEYVKAAQRESRDDIFLDAERWKSKRPPIC